jgi:hypothetical protein
MRRTEYMGIDVYLNWKKKTKKDKESQITGFSTRSGNVGYLREAYHGEPYATRVLMPEGFEDKDDPDGIGVSIPNAVLVARLPATEAAVRERYKNIYQETGEDVDEAVKAYKDFVALHAEKESAGLDPTIYVSY